MIRLLGLEICADTVVGSAMLRGISGGQKKRVTTGQSGGRSMHMRPYTTANTGQYQRYPHALRRPADLPAGEMIVGPIRALFADEISTGLDSNTTFQIMRALRNFTHTMQSSTVVGLLQPQPETFDLFDEVILLSSGLVRYGQDFF